MASWTPGELAEAFRYATDWFRVYVEELNALNVYPVPDGDTGTNMHLTLEAVRRELDLADTSRMPEVARAIAYGSLLGARGNSGVILSQILKGFAEAIRRKDLLDASILREALRLGAETGYRAVMKPVEGTILTVARAAGEGAKGEGLEATLESALAAAKEALERTPELLPVLKQAGVVDAGGAGYVRFLEGLRGYALRLPLPEPPKVERYAQTAFATEAFGYCTEFLMEGVEVPIERIQEAVAPFGDSLLVVGAEGYVKGHIHTDDPDGLLAAVARFGRMVRTKVEDMTQQHTEILAMAGAAAEAPPPTGLLAVALGHGVARAFRSLGARVVAGGQTQNPSVEDLLSAIRSLPNPKAILLPNNPNVFLAAEEAARLAGEGGKEVHVLRTRTMGQGLAAAVRYFPEGEPEELLPEMEAAMAGARTLEVTWASRDAEVDGVKVLKDKPIGLLDGRLVLVGETPEEVLEGLVRLAGEGKEILTLFLGPDTPKEPAQALAERFPALAVEILPGGPDLYAYLGVLE
ncbi:DAK2 domain-containing protein [Thermus thermamylovorans]|uniref:DAK2 domain-containing protein n=1 Tax=Thermus thermamylovorans TaxID=2509362 RepID=A0A4Q9B009_9DEIN|nr:DAK2 domain-containing protein [Thermus thermamylovorans]TBH17488.1 DAK2 domain-containing protein [Thermus thermamylovorans]